MDEEFSRHPADLPCVVPDILLRDVHHPDLADVPHGSRLAGENLDQQEAMGRAIPPAIVLHRTRLPCLDRTAEQASCAYHHPRFLLPHSLPSRLRALVSLRQGQ